MTNFKGNWHELEAISHWSIFLNLKDNYSDPDLFGVRFAITGRVECCLSLLVWLIVGS